MRLRQTLRYRPNNPKAVIDALRYWKIYFFFPFPPSSALGGVGGRSAWFLALLDLWASPLPDEFFLGLRSPILDSRPVVERLKFHFSRYSGFWFGTAVLVDTFEKLYKDLTAFTRTIDEFNSLRVFPGLG